MSGAALVVLLASRPAVSQEFEFPVLTTAGRILGWGYSHNGYHSARNRDGRLNIVTNRHPAQNYGSSRLLYPYNPGYRPVSTQYVPQGKFGYTPSPTLAPIPNQQRQSLKPNVPKEPPPTWLKPYLAEDGEKTKEEIPTPPADSPPSGEGPFYFDKSELPSPSDRTPPTGSDPLLLDDDEDLSESDLRGSSETTDDSNLLDGSSLLDDSSLLDERSSLRGRNFPLSNEQNRYKQARQNTYLGNR